MKILGIDPGVTGALALSDETKTPASGLRWLILDIPVMGDKHPELNSPALRDWLRKHAPDHCFLEAMQFGAPTSDGNRKGLAGAMRFGALYGSIKATLACCDVPMTPIQPQVWKRYFRLMKSSKELSRIRALQLFPDQGETLRRKKDQNRAEAMLIAAYGASRLSEQFAFAAE